jgi:hypothetical protein
MAGGPGKGSLELLLDVTPFFQVRQPDLVRGWSVAPLFVRWNFPAIGDGAARVFGEVSGSLLFTSAPVPVRTTTFNFLDQAGFGVRFEESRGRAWLIGYRFQHISNAGRSARRAPTRCARRAGLQARRAPNNLHSVVTFARQPHRNVGTCPRMSDGPAWKRRIRQQTRQLPENCAGRNVVRRLLFETA